MTLAIIIIQLFIIVLTLLIIQHQKAHIDHYKGEAKYWQERKQDVHQSFNNLLRTNLDTLNDLRSIHRAYDDLDRRYHALMLEVDSVRHGAQA